VKRLLVTSNQSPATSNPYGTNAGFTSFCGFFT
jgi:hypothetical protein